MYQNCMLASIETLCLTKLLCPVSILILDMYSFKVPMFYFKHSFMIPTALFLYFTLILFQVMDKLGKHNLKPVATFLTSHSV